ncbi:glycoside hydrolase family 76 protein [Pedobacter nototheniae]|uniref:glycoside hydrolase family 76 protein n=1 Tax=Pedobacter nototheniae TaxID=2488994 RepID=UPI00292DC458|nr:glycoside hydrolase family 76 protein [Pedobacter nototheniae]
MKFICFLLLLFLQVEVKAQKPKQVYEDRVNIIQKNINLYFTDQAKGLYFESTAKQQENPHSWLWPLCALIQSANEMEVLNKNIKYMMPVERAIDQYYSTVAPAPAYQDYPLKEKLSSRFYDDNQWIALAYLDAYNRTKEKSYLKKSKDIYRFLLTGYDDKAGGGLYWKEGDKNSKNTCSNGPNVLVSLQLYKITKEKKYLDTALLVYNWTNKHLRAATGIFYDAIKIPSLKVDEGTYTYNTGTMLQSNVLLYEITSDKKYLEEAKVIAAAAENHFYKNNKLPDHYWFNAVLLRGYMELFKIEKKSSRLKFIIDDAERIWNEERDAQNLLGRGKEKTLLMQAGIQEIYARLATIN